MTAAQDTALERLTHLGTIKMNQLTSTYRGNNFIVFSGEDVLFNLIEESHDLSIFSFGRRRWFHMNGVDNNTGKRVFSLRRPGTSMADKVELRMNGALVSIIRLKATFLTPVIRIHDAQDYLLLRVKGKITDHVNFELQTKKIPIGSIHKKAHESVKEIRSRLDDYVISFPADLDVQLKVAVIVACVLVDFRFHEFR